MLWLYSRGSPDHDPLGTRPRKQQVTAWAHEGLFAQAMGTCTKPSSLPYHCQSTEPEMLGTAATIYRVDKSHILLSLARLSGAERNPNHKLLIHLLFLCSMISLPILHLAEQQQQQTFCFLRASYSLCFIHCFVHLFNLSHDLRQ